MMRQTSLLAYESLKEDKVLGERQLIVLNYIKKHPDSTDSEIAIGLGHLDRNWIRPRRNELMKKGYIKESGKRNCEITKKLCYTWRVR